MSNTAKVTISNVSLEDALIEITELSNNSTGLIINKNSREQLSQILSGSNDDLEKVAKNPENNKIIESTNKSEQKKVAKSEHGVKADNKVSKPKLSKK